MRVAAEGQLAREHLEDQDAQGVDVAARVDRRALRVLGAHVLGGAQHLARGRGAALLRLPLLRDVEVHEPGHALAVDHHVERLHVAMDEAYLVEGLEAVRDLRCPLEDLLGLEGLPPEHRAQVLPFDELHAQPQAPALVSGREDPADVGMTHLAHEAHLRAEPPNHLGLAREIAPQHLERDLVAEHAVAGPVDRAHSPRPMGLRTS